MTKIIWDESGSRFYELGVDRGVFYDLENNATPWNGLTSVTENVSDVVESVGFIDGQRYMNRISNGNFSATIKAFTYPDILGEYAGESTNGFTNQGVKPFNLTYRTTLGNDISGVDHGYKIHLVYNALAKPVSQNYISYGSVITPTDFVWNVTSVPKILPYLKPSSHFIIDSTKVNSTILSTVEGYLYGTDTTDPGMPTINDLLFVFENNSLFRIIDNGDGSFTATGDDDYVYYVDSTTFGLSSPSVILKNENEYTAKTL